MDYVTEENFGSEHLDTIDQGALPWSEDIEDILIHLEMASEDLGALASEMVVQ